MATHSSILAWKNSMDRGAWRATVHGSQRVVRYAIGRGATNTGRSRTVRNCGLYWRENAGMSSESKVRIFAVESLRFPEEGLSSQGKSGPKPRTTVVGDGQQVDIPAPRKSV